jgi:hypothetical protein
MSNLKINQQLSTSRDSKQARVNEDRARAKAKRKHGSMSSEMEQRNYSASQTPAPKISRKYAEESRVEENFSDGEQQRE